MAAHPLDPLSPSEFQSTADILRRDQGVTDSWRFASIELKEPAKANVKTWKQGDPVDIISFWLKPFGFLTRTRPSTPRTRRPAPAAIAALNMRGDDGFQGYTERVGHV